MAHASSKQLVRSLGLLDHSVSLTLQLGDLVGGNEGRVGVLRSNLKRAQAELNAHRKRQPLDKRLVRRKADQVLCIVVEYLTALKAGSTGNV